MKWLRRLAKHQHSYEIHYTMEEVWLECFCGHQEDVPEDRLNEAYEKIRKGDLTWKIQPSSTTKS